MTSPPPPYRLLVLLLFVACSTLQAQDLSKIGKAKPFTYTGSLSSRFVFYNASGIPNRRDPFGYVVGGNINIGIYELYFPFSFSYSNQGTVYGQPFNQFGVSPTYKWATLHLGYRNISYSSLTLAGHQMLGAGVELNPGKLRVGFMYGRLRRAVQFRPPPDSLSLDTLLQTQPLIPIGEDPVYQRTGWGAKVGYGDDKGFIDLILFKAKDAPSSIDDDSIKQIFRPAQNAVMGINARRTFFNKLNIFFEGAISAITRDGELDDEGGAGDSVSISKVFKPFIPINSTTYYYRAIKAGLGYSHNIFNVQADYQRIDPDYNSMGAYFFNNDIESINITPSVYLFKNKTIVTSGFSFQRDNLNNKKQVTTKRTIPRINVSINPSYKYGIDLGYQDMRTSQASGILELPDSLRMNMSNPGYTAGLRYNIADSLRTHSFMIMGNQFSLKDRNELTQPFSEYTATILNFNYNFYMIKKSLGLTASVTANKLESFSGTVLSTGFSVAGNKGFNDNKIALTATWSANFSELANSHSSNLGVSYAPGKLSLSAQLNYLIAEQGETTFNEFTGFIEARYNLTQKK